ncbi:MAG: DNRLRE domain-containing protein, partial [Phycisphaerae bacterium]
IKSVVGPGASSGPVVCIGPRVVQAITIRSSGGKVRLRNPDPAGPPFIYRYYGFGDTPGQVTLDGVPLAVTDWTDRRITVMLIANTPKTGHIMVQRGDNGRWTEMGVTLHVRDCTTNPVVFLRGGSVWPDTPIQDAIDAAAAGTLIVVGEGTYEENVIVYKNVQLQGAGAGGTFINGNPIPTERVDRWLAKIRALIAGGDLVLVDPEGAQGFFEATEAPVVMVQGKPETFGPGAGALVDGFTLLGGVAGGGVFVPSFADYLQISCNRIMNNQGTFGGAITVGLPNFDIRGLGGVPVDALNEGVGIRHNKIIKNGGITGGGGVTLFAHSKNYAVADNIICGNFSRHVGGGIAHIGRSDGGTIARNRIVFNEVFFGGEVGGDGGGVYVGDDIVFPGLPANPPAAGALGDGAGNVTIDSNLIQGNLAGSASGGGLYARSVNGADVLGSRPFRTLVFQDAAGGYAGTADATIDSTRPNTPLGTATTGVWGRNFLSGDQQWLLLRFDNLIGPGASQIPPGATIRSAQITLTVTDDGGAPPNVYRVLRPWDESTVTWNGFGGLPTAGVDYQTPAEMAAGAIGPIGPSPYEIPIFVTQSVQSWAHGAPNHGWILQPVGGLDVSVASRESPQAGFRPTLEVQYYTGPGNPDQWYSLTVTNNMIVNNVAAYQGGGVVLQNTAKARILHNTISHNDSTATSALAFPPGGLVQSVPQGAGLVSLPHDRLMAEATGQAFSDPLLGNTILWENRSFHWYSGVLVPDGTRDLAVVQGVGVMDPQSCVLTDTTGYAATNIDTDPNFEAAYENTLLTAGVFDEGGTFITVRFEELSVDSGNYHLAPASPVSNRASTALAGLLPELTLDIDGELRPQGLGPEIGADELSPVCGDGTIDAGEGCDDGNTIDGDGCSSACQVESRFGDVDGDGDVDRCDLILILSARGRPADGPDDPRDLDGDGFITALDARMLIPLCDVPRCGRCLP